MTRVLNLIDDANLGGVTRGLADLTHRLGLGLSMEAVKVRTVWCLAPRLQADVLVVDFTLSWAKLLFLLSLRLRHRGPVLLVEHSYTEAYERCCVPARRRFRTMLRICYRLADKVVAVSAGQAAWMRAARLVPASRLVCIPQAIGTEGLADIPPPDRGPGVPLRLGAYGRFAPQKGFDLLVQAMRNVPPAVATLDLAGYGEDETALRAAAAGLPHVHIHGAADPAAFLATIDCVVLPSRWEAYGLVAQEARAAGRPLIVAAVDGLIEQLEVQAGCGLEAGAAVCGREAGAAACGVMVPPNDVAALAAAISAMAARDLAPLATAARASVAGLMEGKVAAWRALLLAVAPDAECEPLHAAPVHHAISQPSQFAKLRGTPC